MVNAVDGSLLNMHGDALSGDALNGIGYPAPAQRIGTVWEAIRVRTEEILAGVTVANLLTENPRDSAATLLLLREVTHA